MDWSLESPEHSYLYSNPQSNMTNVLEITWLKYSCRNCNQLFLDQKVKREWKKQWKLSSTELFMVGKTAKWFWFPPNAWRMNQGHAGLICSAHRGQAIDRHFNSGADFSCFFSRLGREGESCTLEKLPKYVLVKLCSPNIPRYRASNFVRFVHM